MMFLILLLYVTGIVLIVMEVLLPGVVLGLVGVALLSLSIYLSFIEDTALAIGQTVIALVFVPAALFFALKKLQMKQTLQNEKQDLPESSLIGKTAEVINDLKPLGVIIVDGKRIPASSFSEFIERGKQVTIVKIEGTQIFVKKI